MSFMREHRPSDAPISMDLTPGARDGFVASLTTKLNIPPSWIGMSGYLVAGIFLGLVLILALSIGRGESTAAAAVSPNAVTDNVVRLHARDVAAACWAGHEKAGPARLTVALEIGIDGKIRYAAASGETASMRRCVEDHVKAWEFLPQQRAQTMALPFEIDRR